MSRSARRESGMTLIEVMAALTILGLVAVGTLSLVTVSVRQNRLAEMRTIATGLVSERVQQITAHPFMSAANYTEYKLPEETAASGPPQTFTTNYGAMPSHPEFSRVVTLTYDSPASGMLRVQATVSWLDPNQGTKTHMIVTYLHPRLEEGS